jgi:cellulose synthase operon protein YhjQ
MRFRHRKIDEGHMTESNQQSEQTAPPDDVATLYSWANLHGAKYRDFSAARAQTRERARLRAEQAVEEERRQKQLEAEAAQGAEAQSTEAQPTAEASLPVEQDREPELDAHLVAEQAEQQARQAAEQAAASENAVQEPAIPENAIPEHAIPEQQAQEQAAAEPSVAEPAAEEKAVQEKAEQENAELETAEQLHAQQAADEQAKQEQVGAEAETAAHLEAERSAAEKAAELEAAELAAQGAREREQAQQREKALREEKEREQARELAQVRDQAERLAAAHQAAQRTAHLSAERAAQQAAEQLARQRAWQQPLNGRFAASQSPAQPASNSSSQWPSPDPLSQASSSQPQAFRPTASLFPVPPQLVPAREDQAREEIFMPRNPWPAPELKEPAGRPAWLSTEAPDATIPTTSLPPAPPAPPLPQAPLLPPAPEDTLQGSRDRMTSRWFALRGVFDGPVPPVEVPPAPSAARAPSLAVFSLAGGVGKTSLVATLGRALSARGERVLLVDTAAFGLLPFFFGATDQRPGVLRTFTPPGMSSDAPIQLVTIDADVLGSEMLGQESLSGEIQNYARGASRILVDLATASGATTRRIMRMAPLVLVPVVPDMNSVVSVSSIDAFFEHNSSPHGRPVLPYYVLNQFDPSLPLHLDVREVLREQLGERLLAFALRRAPSISEALAEGMTVLDYAPSSSLAEDFSTLAGWLKSISAPATTSYRGVRWSER